MISVEEHLETILAAVHPLAPREVSLSEAHGCVLAQDVESRVSLPGFDNSAMDGYAIRAADLALASDLNPITLVVDGVIPAGDRRRRVLGLKRAWRMMTGGPIPDGADAVVPVDLTDGGTKTVTFRAPTPQGSFIRIKGHDVKHSQVCLKAGVRIGPKELALLAATGNSLVTVIPRPRVVVISTGDELVSPGMIPGFGQVVDTNGMMLAAAVKELGGVPVQISQVPDDHDAVLAAVQSQLARADAVITTGGVSVGVYDTVKAALSRLGTVEFRVAMQPGMPQGFGTLGPRHVPVFTVPGNPVSAMVSFEVFVGPALRAMAGRALRETPAIRAVAIHSWNSPQDKVHYARVTVKVTDWGYQVALCAGQGSHQLGGLADADALAVIPAGVGRVEAGDVVVCLPLRALPTSAPG